MSDEQNLTYTDPSGILRTFNPARIDPQAHKNEMNAIEIQGKTTYSADELLRFAHNHGLVSIVTDLLHIDPHFESSINTRNGQTAVRGFAAVKATVFFMDAGPFTGVGDACGDSVSSANIANAYLRMAETRAIARALTHAMGVSALGSEEMADSGSNNGGNRNNNQQNNYRNQGGNAGAQRRNGPPASDDWN